MSEVVRGVDRTLFEDYVKPKSNVLTSLVRKGIIDSGINWSEMQRPTGKFKCWHSPCNASQWNFSEVRYYIYEILMFLVSVHAEVSATTRNLLERTLAALIVDTVEQALECFQQIKSFGRGGMLREKHHLYLALPE